MKRFAIALLSLPFIVGCSTPETSEATFKKLQALEREVKQIFRADSIEVRYTSDSGKVVNPYISFPNKYKAHYFLHYKNVERLDIPNGGRTLKNLYKKEELLEKMDMVMVSFSWPGVSMGYIIYFI